MSRSYFTRLIAEEGARLGELQAQVHRTFLHRDLDAKSHLEWERACAAFESYGSRLDPLVERVCKYKTVRYTKKNLLEFVVCFLEVDPWFYSSGYLKQIFLRRLKRSDLDEAIKGRLRMVLLDAVDRRGTREFRDYCRLAAVIGDEDLVSVLEKASESTNGAVASRAKLMLSTIRQRQGRRVVAIRLRDDRTAGPAGHQGPSEATATQHPGAAGRTMEGSSDG